MALRAQEGHCTTNGLTSMNISLYLGSHPFGTAAEATNDEAGEGKGRSRSKDQRMIVAKKVEGNNSPDGSEATIEGVGGV